MEGEDPGVPPAVNASSFRTPRSKCSKRRGRQNTFPSGGFTKPYSVTATQRASETHDASFFLFGLISRKINTFEYVYRLILCARPQIRACFDALRWGFIVLWDHLTVLTEMRYNTTTTHL
ncbi:hypothetical protein CHARACLAT_017513 [Characodon lateralis]|uniref:Uncharacterized protein n=1 Tax=Characodon lateralis TaxID=208331 RepID=A0ABU7CP15_9TELE|nr:hypothetical protein [Characodon lateralis]